VGEHAFAERRTDRAEVDQYRRELRKWSLPDRRSPAISDGVVFVAVDGGSIYALALPPNLNTNAVRRAGPPLPASFHADPRLLVTP
jgi:hypothetical protein